MGDEMKCAFCRLDPYEYVDVGIGKVPVAVNCCEFGYLLYDGGEQYNHCGMPIEQAISQARKLGLSWLESKKVMWRYKRAE